MEIIVEDFITGQQESKVVPDDTVFISKNGKHYHGDTIYKVVSSVENTQLMEKYNIRVLEEKKAIW